MRGWKEKIWERRKPFPATTAPRICCLCKSKPQLWFLPYAFMSIVYSFQNHAFPHRVFVGSMLFSLFIVGSVVLNQNRPMHYFQCDLHELIASMTNSPNTSHRRPNDNMQERYAAKTASQFQMLAIFVWKPPRAQCAHAQVTQFLVGYWYLILTEMWMRRRGERRWIEKNTFP